MERKQEEIAARPVKPTPEEKKAHVDAVRQQLIAKVEQKIFAALDAHKKVHGTANLDNVVIGASLACFTNLLIGHQRFVPGRETDALIRFGIDVIAQAGVDAKKRCEDRRIVIA